MVDVRFICATKKNLGTQVKQGRFREDLYYRINVVAVTLPPLRERREDIILLARCFLVTQAASLGRPCPELSPDVCRILLDYSWPGNLRELKHAMEYALSLSTAGTLDVRDLPPTLVGPAEFEGCEHCLSGREAIDLSSFLSGAERAAIRWALTRAKGNQSRAAQLLGIPRTTLRDRLAALFDDEAQDEGLRG
jgi:transcriptional regulator with PAS, ATPase and Fis domain